MAQLGLQGIIRRAEICSTANRMPNQIEWLVIDGRQLDEYCLEQLRRVLVSRGLAERMARRAAQAAPSSVVGANRIIDSMVVMFGQGHTLRLLRAVEYDRRVAACARRFATKARPGRLKKAKDLYEHLSNLFGGEPHIKDLGEIIRQAGSLAATSV